MSRGIGRASANSVRSVNYATSPLLASKTPPWRSRFVVALVVWRLPCCWAAPSGCRSWATEFYQAEGEKRFVHKEPLPASRGRILDRNGLVLATSVALPSVQVDGTNFAADTAQRKALARLLGMPPWGTGRRSPAAPAAWSPCAGWSKSRCGSRSRRWASRACRSVREYKRRYPEGESAAHVVGFTNIDDKGRKASSWVSSHSCWASPASAPWCATAWAAWSRTWATRPTRWTAATSRCPSTPRCSSSPTSACATRCSEHKAKAGSVVVLDVQTGEVLALANYPSYDPARATTSAARSCATAR
jgi:cell division protein FtsI (penicillin-binding protein 3)